MEWTQKQIEDGDIEWREQSLFAKKHYENKLWNTVSMTYGKTVKIWAVRENQTRMSRNMSNRGRPESGRSSSVAGTNREWWSETVLLVLQVESNRRGEE